ncbi:MAG: hypothetical protein A2020_04395 [Lentisphaerae bacterium GWF2_45_14]|nr:MAG: hypothetical protein A2020_04395 [Lentisphaerae bacterium GWF2_45_14]
MKQKTLSIIIPVYNEEGTIKKLLELVKNAPLAINKELVIVNDGSLDSSRDIILKWRLENPDTASFSTLYIDKANGGKGSAVREGIIKSSGDIVIIQDADLEYDPADYQICIDPILNGETKVVYGSRELSNRNRIYSTPSFYIGGLTLTYWINLLYGSDLTDEPTCYKTFDGKLIRTLLFRGDKFEWEPEITAKLLRLGYTIKEVTVTYRPRKLEEGKKIKWTDGVSGLWCALYWRFAGISSERKKLTSILSEHSLVRDCRRKFYAMLSIFIIALAIRLLCAIPGMSEPEKLLFRPDSSQYYNIALSILQDGAYNTAPGSGIPAVVRVPGYPAYLAALLFISNNSLPFCVIVSCFLSALICVVIFYTGDYVAGWRVGAVASLLFALNITSIALGPMFLSDTLFACVAAVQMYFFFRFYYSKMFFYLLISIGFASLGALIRPLNQFWIAPCLVLILMGNLSLKKKGGASICAVLIFGIIIGPWVLRNKLCGAGWRLDGISGDIVFHNGAVLLSKMTGDDQGKVRARLFAEAKDEFEKHPGLYRDAGSRIAWGEKRFYSMVGDAPFTYLGLHFRPYVLFPDAPSFLQNLGITVGERGTFDVLSRHGIVAAVKHYFKSGYGPLFMVMPLLLIAFCTYCAAGAFLLRSLWKRQWFMLLCFLAFVEFYLFVPGPINMPRYQLPALPLLCVFAAVYVFSIKKYLEEHGFKLRIF